MLALTALSISQPRPRAPAPACPRPHAPTRRRRRMRPPAPAHAWTGRRTRGTMRGRPAGPHACNARQPYPLISPRGPIFLVLSRVLLPCGPRHYHDWTALVEGYILGKRETETDQNWARYVHARIESTAPTSRPVCSIRHGRQKPPQSGIF